MILQTSDEYAKIEKANRRRFQWYKWLAWYPVWLEDTGDLVWLESVYRKDKIVSYTEGTFLESRYISDPVNDSPIETSSARPPHESTSGVK